MSTKLAGRAAELGAEPGGCDCEGLFAGYLAGLPYWDGDSWVILEFPVGGGPWTLKVENGVPYWSNDT